MKNKNRIPREGTPEKYNKLRLSGRNYAQA